MGGVPRCDNNSKAYPYYPVFFVGGDLQATYLFVNVQKNVTGWADSFYTRLTPIQIGPGRAPLPEINIDVKR